MLDQVVLACAMLVASIQAPTPETRKAIEAGVAHIPLSFLGIYRRPWSEQAELPMNTGAVWMFTPEFAVAEVSRRFIRGSMPGGKPYRVVLQHVGSEWKAVSWSIR